MDFNCPWSVFNVFELFSNYKIHTEIFLTVFWLAVLEVSSGFQLVKLGERGGHRRDFHDSGINTRHAMEHVRESKTGLSSLAIDNYENSLHMYIWLWIDLHIKLLPYVFVLSQEQVALQLRWQQIIIASCHAPSGSFISTMWTTILRWSHVVCDLLFSSSMMKYLVQHGALMELCFFCPIDCTTR